MLRHEEAQELHRIIGGPVETRQGNHQEYGTIPMKDLERARELAALIVADTMEGVGTPTPQPITMYFTGDEEGPDVFGLVYDNEQDAVGCARENDLHVYAVPVIPDLDKAARIKIEEND